MADRQGKIPPQVVWVRLGNCRKTALLQAFTTVLPQLRALLDEGGRAIDCQAPHAHSRCRLHHDPVAHLLEQDEDPVLDLVGHQRLADRAEDGAPTGRA
jgi:hypothetical protein